MARLAFCGCNIQDLISHLLVDLLRRLHHDCVEFLHRTYFMDDHFLEKLHDLEGLQIPYLVFQYYVALFVFWLLTLAKRLIELMLGVFEFFMHLLKLVWE